MSKKLLKIGSSVTEISGIEIGTEEEIKAHTAKEAKPVSGVKDGDNWTSITIGEDTGNIPAGGGGSTVETSTQSVAGADTINSIKVDGVDHNLPQGGGGISVNEVTLAQANDNYQWVTVDDFAPGLYQIVMNDENGYNANSAVLFYVNDAILEANCGSMQFCIIANTGTDGEGTTGQCVGYYNIEKDMTTTKLKISIDKIFDTSADIKYDEGYVLHLYKLM